MTSLRKAGWFVVLALAMAGWMGLLGSLRGVAEAGLIDGRLDPGSCCRCHGNRNDVKCR